MTFVPGVPINISSGSGSLEPIATNTILGNALGTTSTPQALSAATTRTVIGLDTASSPSFTGLALTGTGTLQLPAGTTAQRVAVQGVRWNSTDSRHEFYNPSTATWGNFARLSGDTFTGKITGNNGINIANNQFIEFARTTGYVGWFTFGVDTSNILNLRANNAVISMDPVAGSATFSGSIIVGGPVTLSTSTTGAAAGSIYRNANTLRYRDSTNTERLLLNATDNLANLANTATARTNIGLGTGDSPTFSALTVTNGTTLGVRTIATLPLASTAAGQSFRVSDSPVTANRIVTSDGTDWHYEGLAYNVGTKVAGSIVIKIDTTTTGQKNLFLRVPYACTIVSWELAANASGSVVVDVWKDSYANYPPVNADSITGSDKPTLTAANRAQSSTLTGWTTSIAAGDYIEVEVESVTTITSVTLTINVERVS